MSYINPLKHYEYTLHYMMNKEIFSYYQSVMDKDHEISVWEQIREMFILAEQVLNEPDSE